MKLDHKQSDYFVLLGLTGAFAVMYILRKELFWIIGGLVLLGLALIRKNVKIKGPK